MPSINIYNATRSKNPLFGPQAIHMNRQQSKHHKDETRNTNSFRSNEYVYPLRVFCFSVCVRLVRVNAYLCICRTYTHMNGGVSFSADPPTYPTAVHNAPLRVRTSQSGQRLCTSHSTAPRGRKRVDIPRAKPSTFRIVLSERGFCVLCGCVMRP